MRQHCPKCSGGVSIDLDCFIERAKKIHGDLYDYRNVIYRGSYVKIEIICRKHGSFMQTPHGHLRNHGCKNCTHITSKPEIEWLNSLNIPLEFRSKTIRINGKLIKPDAIDLENKIIWEFYGDFWHGNPQKYNPTDINSTNKCEFGYLYDKTMARNELLYQNGYKVIYIWESDFKKKLQYSI